MKAVLGLIFAFTVVDGAPWHRLQAIFKLPTSLTGGLSSSAIKDAANDLDQNTIPTTSMSDVKTNFLNNGEEDPATTDHVHMQMQRMLGGDLHGVILDGLHHPDQLELFGHPEASYNMLQVFPMLKVFPPVQALASKTQDEWTSSDGLAMLQAIKDFAVKAIEHMEATSDHTGYIDKMNKYYELGQTHPEWGALFRRVESGDRQASTDLHNKVFDDLWGNVIDKDAMGMGGIEPDFLVQLREQVINNEPDLWSLITDDDPMTQKLVSDPMSALDAAASLTQLEMEAADNAGSSRVARA